MTSIGNTPASYITTLLQPTGPVHFGPKWTPGPGDTDEAADAILKIVDTISTKASAATKTAAARIGEEAMRAAEIWASHNHGSSDGVRYYERPEDIEDPVERAAMIKLAKEQAEWNERTPGMHHWPESIREGQKIFALMENYFWTDFSYTTGRAGGTFVPPQSSMATLQFLGTLRTKIDALTADMEAVADITGHIVSQRTDGQLELGKFEMRDKRTGNLYMKMGDDHFLRYYDMGKEFLALDYSDGGVEP